MTPPTLRNNKSKVNAPCASPTILSSNAIGQLKSELLLEFSALMKSFEERVLQKMSDIAAEVSNLRFELQVSKNNVIKLTKRCENAEYDLSKLRTAFNKIESDSVASDILILNVPNNLDAGDVVAKLTAAMSCSDIVVRKVFRTHSLSDSNKSAPIIAKFNNSEDRVRLFKALSLFRKNYKQKQLTLANIGLTESSNILIHECLSSLNREILQSALRFKRDKLLVTAYSMRGNVYAKTKIDGKPIKLMCIDDLHKIVGTN